MTTAPVSSSRLSAILAACFGAAIVTFVGLSPLSTVQNAAHDSRQAFASRCH